jgi:hypothetical protein
MEALEAFASRRSRELPTEESANQETRHSVEDPVPASAELLRGRPEITERNEKASSDDDDFITSSTEESENVETRHSDEEPVPTAMVVDEPPIEYSCGWGSLVRKYNSDTTNHYKNWLFPRASVAAQRNASQVK